MSCLCVQNAAGGVAPSDSFYAPELRGVLAGTLPANSTGAPFQDIDLFFKCMALCHTVVPEREHAHGPAVYQAESPDEGALVGVRFLTLASYCVCEPTYQLIC